MFIEIIEECRSGSSIKLAFWSLNMYTYSYAMSSSLPANAIGLADTFNVLVAGLDSKIPSYPKFNIVKNDKEGNSYLIELALAGIKKENIKVKLEDCSLYVEAETPAHDSREYTHKGIATRSFTQKFSLTPDLKVGKVKYQDGILSINIDRVIPEDKKPKLLEID